MIRLAALALLICPGWAIAGDSVTYDSRQELEARGAVVQAFGGVDIEQGRPALLQFAREGRDVVVVALGALDVARHATPSQIRARIRAALGDLASVPCVLWVDLRPTAPNPGWAADAARFNTIIRSIAPHVLGWAAYSHGHRSWFRADNYHPNRQGQAAYARFVASRVTGSTCSRTATVIPTGGQP